MGSSPEALIDIKDPPLSRHHTIIILCEELELHLSPYMHTQTHTQIKLSAIKDRNLIV